MTQKQLLSHPQALCNMVRRIALEAGAITLDYFEDSGISPSEAKKDGSPVTVADRAAEAHIEKALRNLTPDVPFIGEEAVAEGRIPDLAGAAYFWLVDALDGTKEFISGNGDYTVNIALIKDGVPSLGVVYAPVRGVLYAGCGAGTALCYQEDTGSEKKIKARAAPASGLTVVASSRHSNDETLNNFLASYKVAKIAKYGSPLKICAVAAGKADLYPRLGPTCEWDIAAGEAVLRAAGGKMADLEGYSLRYGKTAEKFLNPFFVVSGAA